VKQHKTVTSYETAKRLLDALMEEWTTLSEVIA
jgi:hypothetical protein